MPGLSVLRVTAYALEGLKAVGEALGAALPLLLTLAMGFGIFISWYEYGQANMWMAIFATIFLLRYTRFLGFSIGYSAMYRPATGLGAPYTRQDVTVIVPTVDPNGPDFEECIQTIVANRPAAIMVVTVGAQLKEECRRVLAAHVHEAGATTISVSAIARPSKRRQIAHVMPHVFTPITILADDHVFWPSENFIPAVLAPFEDDNVGMVATKKRVRRTTPGKWSWASIVNFIACNYLERHNWELRASNGMDGGVFVISGRTAVYRTDFLADPDLLEHFCNERFFFGLLGGPEGLGPDDDNFLTREAIKAKWFIKFQDTEAATIETTLGDWPKFHGQLLRWARTTFRSNPAMFGDFDFLFFQTWTAGWVYLSGMLNFAIVWDAALIFSTVKACLASSDASLDSGLFLIIAWILTTKAIKILPVFTRNPSDIPLFVCQVAFAYIHSFYKLWALVTFWDCDWSGRNLDDVEQAGPNPDLGNIEVI